MGAAFSRIMLRGCLLAFVLATGSAGADTPIKLFKPFAGNVNFTGTQKTMRTSPNGSNPCSVNTADMNMPLNGIPSGATVLSAHLYWAGSSPTPDYDVQFDGGSVKAPLDRQYVVDTEPGNTNNNRRLFFAGASDVTAQVAAKRNATYTVGGLAISGGNSSNYCANQTVLGGFQLLVVYSLPSETFRVLNIYEGFQFINYSSKTLVLSNFQIPDPIGSVTGRVGHITWEGDQTLADAEFLMYNDVKMFDATNPLSNQFNSGSNINGDSASYGIDFDAYTVAADTIKGGQTEAYTTYKSGQDLVLMNAEIIAAPNVPATDRTIKMTLNNTMTPSQPSIYTITVGNNGPLTETGPIKVTSTLPAMLIYGGATGTGWTCVAAGQVITCTYPSSLAMGGTLPTIALKVTPAASATGLVSTSAKVSGVLFDHDDGNNTATVSVRVGQAAFTPVYVFTDSVCVHGEPFDTPAQSCKRIVFDGKQVLANEDIHMHITYTINEVPTSLAITDTTLKMKFALSCHSPGTDAGVAAKFYQKNTSVLALTMCAQQGLVPPASSVVWGTAFRDIVFKGNAASSINAYTFNYADVGRIELLAIDQSGNLGSTAPFVSRPAVLFMPAILGNNAGMPAATTDGKFIPAGQNFTLTVQALSSGSVPVLTPNFGRENTVKLDLTMAAATDSGAHTFPEMMVDDTDQTKPKLYEPVPALRGVLGAFSGGAASGSLAFDEVGTIRISVSVDDYLGSGKLSSAPLNIGRFYPHRFVTAATIPLACHDKLVCATGVSGGAYSKQPFDVVVTAINTQNKPTYNYRGALARDFVLGAYSVALGNTANPPVATPGALSAASGAATTFKYGTATARPVYTFAAPAAGSYQSPTDIFLRASEVSGDGVTSQIANGTEVGVVIVTGRMMVRGGYGSEKLPLSLRFQAEFYGGAAGWFPSVTDNVSSFANSDMVFSNCKKNLSAGGGGACKPVLSATPAGPHTLLKGATEIGGAKAVRLLAPGAGNDGSTDLNLTSPVWLPSNKARLTFGTYRAPYIYLRETY